MGWTAEELRFDLWQRHDIFLLEWPHRLCRPTSLPLNVYREPFARRQSGQSLKLIAQVRPQPTLRMTAVVPPFLHMSSWHAQRQLHQVQKYFVTQWPYAEALTNAGGSTNVSFDNKCCFGCGLQGSEWTNMLPPYSGLTLNMEAACCFKMLEVSKPRKPQSSWVRSLA